MPVHALTSRPRARRLVAVPVASLFGLVALVWLAAPASAHSQLISMDPADGSTVAVAPTQVVLTFDENIQHIGAAVVVIGPGGTRVDDGPVVVAGPTATEQLHPLTTPGRYTVSYRVVSDDGHPVTCTLGFVLVGVTASASSGGAPADTGPGTQAGTVPHASASASGGLVAPAVILLVAAVAATGLAVVRLRARRRRA
jgi:copper resistance protein C